MPCGCSRRPPAEARPAAPRTADTARAAGRPPAEAPRRAARSGGPGEPGYYWSGPRRRRGE